MIVVSTSVPPFIISPVADITRFIASKKRLLILFSSSRCLRLHNVVSSGTDYPQSFFSLSSLKLYHNLLDYVNKGLHLK